MTRVRRLQTLEIPQGGGGAVIPLHLRRSGTAESNASVGMKRKIAAILAADVAEYSRLVAEDEEDALRRLVSAQGVFKECVATHRGRIFNTAGDAILAEFASAVDAARCALDIQDRMAASNKEYPTSRQIHFRIGLSIGDVVEHEGDLLGDGVNIAARLQGLAPLGGLAISHWVQEQTTGKLTVKFRDIGQQSLKNIPAPVHVFVADLIPKVAPLHLLPNQAKAARTRQSLRLILVGAAIVAVVGLAFVFNRSQNRSQDATNTTAKILAAPPGAISPAAAPQAQPATVLKATTPPLAPVPTNASPTIGATAPVIVPPSTMATPAPTLPTVRETVPIVPSRPTGLPAASAPVAKDQAVSARKSAQVCAEIMERAQLGDLSADDRAFLRAQCR